MDNESGHQNLVIETDSFWKKKRYLIVLLAFFGFFNVYALRVNLSIAIVAMTENRTVEYPNGTSISTPEFDWDSTQRGIVLSSFFYGYLLTQFIGGYLGFRFGGNLIFGLGIAVTGVLTLFTPLAAKSHFLWLITVRIIEGLFEGVTFPCMYDVWSNWAPQNERTRMAGLAVAGNYFGTVVGLPISGILASYFGWESVFYVFGVLALVWCVIWMLTVKRSPKDDRSISETEKLYILQNIGRDDGDEDEKREIPWRKIVTSMPVWAIIVAHFCESWGFFTMFTQLPAFMKDILNFDLAQSGFLSALPYLALCLLVIFSSFLADYLQIRRILTTSQVRRYFNCSSFIGQAIFITLAAFVLHPTYSVILLTFGFGIGAFSLSGFMVNHLDIAPRFAQILFGITNFFGTIPGIISPILTGYLVRTPSADEYKIVFYITSAFYLFGALFYWFCASGEQQKWAMKSKKCQNLNKNI